MADNVNAKTGGCTPAGAAHPARAHGSVIAYFNREPAHAAAPDQSRSTGSSPGDEGDVAGAREVIYPDDIDDWAARLEVTPEQLQAAIRRVGAGVDDVTRYLSNPDVV